MNTSTSSQMLLAFWRQRDLDAPWPRRLLLVVMLLGISTSLYFAPQLWLALLAASAALVLASLWMTLAGSLLEQNHPHAARFVPGHLRQLREAALGTWVVLTLACAGLLWLCVPHMPPLPTLLLLVAATLAFTAWALRNWVLWLVVSFAPALFFGAGLDRRLAPLGQALHGLWSAQPWSVLALCLMALGWSITRLFGNGDGAHREAYARRARMQRAAREGIASGKPGDVGMLGRPGNWLALPFDRAISGWLRHVLAQARPGERSVMSRLEIVLHGQQHWLRQGMGVLLGMGVAALSFVIAFGVFGGGLQANWTHGAFGMAIGLASMGFNPGFTLPTMLWHSRREQALLRLLPGVPQGRALNRAVAWLQLRHVLAAWVLTTIALALLAWAAGDAALLCLTFGALPLCATFLLRAPARMRAPSAWNVAMPVLAFMLLAWGLYTLHQKLGAPLVLLAGLSVGVSVALGLWRWRAIIQAPTALPTGRLS